MQWHKRWESPQREEDTNQNLKSGFVPHETSIVAQLYQSKYQSFLGRSISVCYYLD